jgi:hypothetical protein
MAMELSRSEGRAIRDPTPDDIEAALNELDNDDAFLILAAAAEEYVQAAGTCLEYRAAGHHYRAVEPCGRDVVRRVFLAYLAGDGQWRALTEWQDVTEEVSAVRGARCGWYLAGIVGLLLAFVAYLLLR